MVVEPEVPPVLEPVFEPVELVEVVVLLVFEPELTDREPVALVPDALEPLVVVVEPVLDPPPKLRVEA